MNIHITGRHIEITQGIRDHIAEKLGHERLFDRIMDIHITLSVDHGSQIAEATVHIAHQSAIHAKADSGDLFASIDMMMHKLRAQIQSHKEKEITKRDHHVHGEFCNHGDEE